PRSRSRYQISRLDRSCFGTWNKERRTKNRNAEHEPGTGNVEHGTVRFSNCVRVVVDINRLQIGVHVERLGAGLAPSIAGLTQAAERQMRLAALHSPIDEGHAPP